MRQAWPRWQSRQGWRARAAWASRPGWPRSDSHVTGWEQVLMENGKGNDHVEIIAALMAEIRANLSQYDLAATEILSRADMLALRLEQNQRLADLLHQHRRALRFMNGDPVEAEVQFGEAIVIGTMGGGV